MGDDPRAPGPDRCVRPLREDDQIGHARTVMKSIHKEIQQGVAKATYRDGDRIDNNPFYRAVTEKTHPRVFHRIDVSIRDSVDLCTNVPASVAIRMKSDAAAANRLSLSNELLRT